MMNSFNIPTTIIISGVEPDRYWDIVVNQCKRDIVLMSYYYLQQKPKDFLKKRIEKAPNVKVFIDSGAHTFMSKSGFEDKPLSFWENYAENYVQFVRDNKDFIFACANLDLELLFGIEQIDEWDEKYFKPLEKEGIPVCYIWHTPRGEKGWEEMCRKHSYVGFSMENDKEVTIQRVMRRLKVAEKYNTKVHGMALTKTEILVRVPFFTVDSTTWLVGQQYGELNWFNGRKMQRLKKPDWQRQYKTKLLREPFNADWDKLMSGDTYELLRLNVITYQIAEEYIRKRLRNKMYWLSKNNKERVSLDSLETPPLEWFTGECNDWEDYLLKLNISPSNYKKEEAINVLYFFYIFLNKDYDKLKEDFTEKEIIDYAKIISGEDIKSFDKAVEVLEDYYIKNATGERNDLRGEDDMDEELLRPKEREEYLEEDEFEIIDLSAEEISKNFQLPPPKDNSMPEVEAYDEELRKNDIVPVRDEKGRFLKGQKRVRKPKNLYSSKYPKLNCNTCYKAGDCPEYKPGYVCAYDKLLKRFDTRNYADVIEAMTSMINFNLERLQRAMIFETMDGGIPTQEVTSLIDQNAKLLEKLKDLQQSRTIVSQRKIIKDDGTEETVTQLHMNPQGDGILSKLFNNLASKNENEKNDNKDNKVIDGEYEVEE